MKLRRAAAVLFAVIGIIHLYLAPEYLDEETYIGVLFVLTGAAAAVVAPRLWFVGGHAAWILGAAFLALFVHREWAIALTAAGLVATGESQSPRPDRERTALRRSA